MSLITRMRKQVAVYWQRGDTPNDFGAFSFEDPVEIACRWEDSNVEFLNAKGERALSKALVYVDRDMKPGDILLLGELDSSINEDDPRANEGAEEVARFDKLPNLKNTEYLRTAYLSTQRS